MFKIKPQFCQKIPTKTIKDKTLALLEEAIGIKTINDHTYYQEKINNKIQEQINKEEKIKQYYQWFIAQQNKLANDLATAMNNLNNCQIDTTTIKCSLKEQVPSPCLNNQLWQIYNEETPIAEAFIYNEQNFNDERYVYEKASEPLLKLNLYQLEILFIEKTLCLTTIEDLENRLIDHLIQKHYDKKN